MGCDGDPAQQRSADEQGTPSASVRLASGVGPEQESGHGEGADRDAHSRLVRAERTRRETRGDRDQQALRDEVGELGDAQHDEGPREEPGGRRGLDSSDHERSLSIRLLSTGAVLGAGAPQGTRRRGVSVQQLPGEPL